MTSGTPARLGAIAHYTLLERLDASGPGELFRARDTRLGRTVAVRLLPPDVPGPGRPAEALLEDVRTVASLSHPNVTAVFDAGEHEGRLYLVFEYIEGRSLHTEMAGAPLHVRRAVELGVQIADAVAGAHAAGFVHRGLSPESIMVSDQGHAKVPALALASRGGFADGGVRLRDCESPEEASGSPGDERSDVYSVAAILFEMLTARRPLHRGAAAPSASNPTVPAALDAVVLQALSSRPEARQPAAAVLAAELRQVAAMLAAPADAERDAPEREPAGSSVPLLVAAAVILAGLALVVWWLTRP